MASKDFISKFLKRDKKLLWAFGAAICLAVGALGSTLAANINLNGGDNVEFGQGVAQTTACSGGDSITITPQSTFVNEVGAGAAYFTSVELSGIPSSCLGKVFTIQAYDESGDTTGLTSCGDSDAKLALIFNGASTAQTNQSYDAMFAEVMHADSTSFNVTWHNIDRNGACRSMVLASAVTRITIQSTSTVPGEGAYVADFTSGNTNFVSTPLISLDATSTTPSARVWANTGSLQSAGDLTFNAQPGIDSSSNPYASIESIINATGDVGSIATSADRMTVEMWVYLQNGGGEWDGNLFSFDTNDNRGPIEYCGYSLAFNLGHLGINTCQQDNMGIDGSSLNGGWHHIVWIASTGARYTQKIYVDGTLQTLTKFSSGNELPDEASRPNIGNGQFGINTWNTSTSMRLGALKIYEGEMPGSTVAAHAISFQVRLP